MAFELLKKLIVGKCRLPNNTISISKSTIRLSGDLTKYFIDKPNMEVYIDRKNLQIGILPSANKMKGFRTFLNKSNGGDYITSTIQFLRKNIAFGHYPITIDDDGMFVFSVKEIATN